MKYTEAHGLGGAPTAPAATEATLQQLLTRATLSNANEATGNANTAAIIVKLQEIINNRKPFAIVECIDLPSHVKAIHNVAEDGTAKVEISEVWENGAQTSAQNVNWGIDDNVGGTNFTYDTTMLGSHEITVQGAEGLVFRRWYNTRQRKAINFDEKYFYFTEKINGEIDYKDYFNLITYDAGGNTALVGSFAKDWQSYAPALPDTGTNKRLLNRPQDMQGFGQQRSTLLPAGNAVTIPRNRIFSLGFEHLAGSEYSVQFELSDLVWYGDARLFAAISASGVYFNQSITINCTVGEVVVKTIS